MCYGRDEQGRSLMPLNTVPPGQCRPIKTTFNLSVEEWTSPLSPPCPSLPPRRCYSCPARRRRVQRQRPIKSLIPQVPRAYAQPCQSVLGPILPFIAEAIFYSSHLALLNLERVGRKENFKEVRRLEHKRDGQGTRFRPRIDSSESRWKPNARRQVAIAITAAAPSGGGEHNSNLS
ncbi:hypothetical protein GALMADRAFT_1248474 [Galerina marginata CBS 339.88]|uniref:Uncharacterized protein n=1 Tax=Galerina marginata (strain CBS 339.88) TaxID=685588 RepID=A0A067SFY6_GALM3|nr:hypothetical protein GALMADRAFT_1248474 [Galerina marginata CBS 339.88]